jgi:class 3 adenylate cyclase/streptogramin lyase
VSQATSATATFLFTDIEGSTQLLKAHRDEYATILAEHHRLLREAFTAYGGREVDNQGDSFFVAFARAKDAVLAAAAAQRALAEHSWPGGAAVRVRMGIHTGEADLAVDRYVGLSVHRAARISAVGHGGQVLVSPTTAHLLEADEADLPGIALRDLGEHRLKDISRPVRLYQLDVDGLPRTFPPLEVARPPERDRRRRAVLVAAVLLLAAIAAVAVALMRRDAPPPEVLPNSLVRIDPSTLQATEVVPIGSGADLIVSAGGYLWITHYVLRDIDSAALRDAGDRTLTRVDPTKGDVTTVGGGLAPCGLEADPSGDVWVANCFASGGPTANVVRIDATTLEFEATWPVPPGDGFVRGLAYGGGSLWVSEIAGGGDSPPEPPHTVMQVDAQTGEQQSIRLPNPGTPLAWSGGYGDLWICSFPLGSVMRVHTATRDVEVIEGVAFGPTSPVVDGDAVWVGDWDEPQLVRLSAVGSRRPRTISLPVQNRDAGVWRVAAGAGHVWATTPRDGALWRVDPKTNEVTRIAIPHLPTGITADGDDVWVAVRER